jgi:hypothetical protein
MSGSKACTYAGKATSLTWDDMGQKHSKPTASFIPLKWIIYLS